MPPPGLGLAGGIDYSDPEVYRRAYWTASLADDDGDDAGGYDYEKGCVTYDGIPLQDWDLDDPMIGRETRDNILSARAYMAGQKTNETAPELQGKSQQDDDSNITTPQAGGCEEFLISQPKGNTPVGKENLGGFGDKPQAPDVKNWPFAVY